MTFGNRTILNKHTSEQDVTGPLDPVNDNSPKEQTCDWLLDKAQVTWCKQTQLLQQHVASVWSMTSGCTVAGHHSGCHRSQEVQRSNSDLAGNVGDRRAQQEQKQEGSQR